MTPDNSVDPTSSTTATHLSPPHRPRKYVAVPPLLDPHQAELELEPPRLLLTKTNYYIWRAETTAMLKEILCWDAEADKIVETDLPIYYLGRPTTLGRLIWELLSVEVQQHLGVYVWNNGVLLWGRLAREYGYKV